MGAHVGVHRLSHTAPFSLLQQISQSPCHTKYSKTKSTQPTHHYKKLRSLRSVKNYCTGAEHWIPPAGDWEVILESQCLADSHWRRIKEVPGRSGRLQQGHCSFATVKTSEITNHRPRQGHIFPRIRVVNVRCAFSTINLRDLSL